MPPISQKQELLEIVKRIDEKVSASKVLNGGYEKLEDRLKALEASTSKINNSVEFLSTELNKPTDGLIDKFKHHLESDERIQSAIKEQIKPIVEFNKRLKKIFWISLSGLLFPFVIEVVKHFWLK
jgi:hypothetical protein